MRSPDEVTHKLELRLSAGRTLVGSACSLGLKREAKRSLDLRHVTCPLCRKQVRRLRKKQKEAQTGGG